MSEKTQGAGSSEAKPAPLLDLELPISDERQSTEKDKASQAFHQQMEQTMAAEQRRGHQLEATEMAWDQYLDHLREQDRKATTDLVRSVGWGVTGGIAGGLLLQLFRRRK